MERILIVEDDDAFLMLEKEYLEAAGFSVDAAHDGREGLEKALDNDYSLVILDILLPVSDGFAVLSGLREKKDIPAVMVSARKDEIDKVRSFSLGADDYIEKPFSPAEFTARIKARIERYRILTNGSETEDTLKIRGVSLNKKTRRVFSEGTEKKLSAKEFELLKYLMSHPNEVFSKQELFREIWNADDIGDIETVAVHVKKLREKIERDSSSPKYLETVWGKGYRFRA